jgi:hypothetical protein
MKHSAIRYAEILEAEAWVTHQEQEDIAKLLRKLAMTEDEAWDLLEAKQQKAKAKPVTEREALKIAHNALIEIDKETPYPLAKHAAMVIKSVLEALAQPEQEPEQGCAECGKKASEGWALYCVKCTEPFKPDWDMIEPYHERIKELEIENEKLRQELAKHKEQA